MAKKPRCPKFERLTRKEVEEFYEQALRRLEVARLNAHINLVLGATNRDYAADVKEDEDLEKILREDLTRVMLFNFGEEDD